MSSTVKNRNKQKIFNAFLLFNHRNLMKYETSNGKFAHCKQKQIQFQKSGIAHYLDLFFFVAF